MSDFNKELRPLYDLANACEFEDFERALKELISEKIIGEDEDEKSTPYHDYSLVSKENRRVTNAICNNRLRIRQRKALSINTDIKKEK